MQKQLSKAPSNPWMEERVQQHMRIFDGFVELVYVMDLESYELLYLNEAGRTHFHMEAYEHKKCYEILYGKTEPCSFCPNAHVTHEEFYEWKRHNEIINRHVLLKDIIIRWYGKPAKLEIAYDVTDQDQQLTALKNAYQIEQVTMDCVRKLYEASNPKEAIDTVLGKAGTFLKADRAFVFEFIGNTFTNTYEWCAEGISSAKEELQEMDLNLLKPAKTEFAHHESFIMMDTAEWKSKFPQTCELMLAHDVKSLVMAPIYKKQHLIGCIGVSNPDMERLRSFSMLDTLGYFISLSFEKMETQQMMMEYSYMDGLTGLYNRNRYMQDLNAYEEQQIPVYGVVYLDINDLKGVNDRHGHIGGDALLKEAAAYLKQVFKQEDCYRIGGDEFVILIQHLSLEQLEERLQQLGNLFVLSKRCSAAIGYVYNQAGNLSEMVKQADEQMYENKKAYYRTHSGNGRYRSFQDEALLLQMPDEVEKAISRGQFTVYLQPKASIDIQKVIGSEALVRYIDAQGKLIPPDQFIPILEDSHTIHLIDFYVFETVCQTIATWLEQGADVKPVSINFSRYTLMLDHFVQRITTIWSRYAIPQNLLEIEIIERAENVGNEYLIHVMKEIKRMGFRVSIDDFGVKYSNLFLFTNTNIDTLKLDRSLVQDLTENQKSQMIIDALAKLCENLHIQLIVEGVETKEQLEILVRLRCDGIQGYLFCRPIPLQEFSQRYVTSHEEETNKA